MTELLISPQWLSILSKHARLVVAYSGGSDSTALLHALTQQLGASTTIVALHINHGLNPRAQEWERHCQSYCNTLVIDFFSIKVTVSKQSNIEACAREARYKAINAFVQQDDAVLMAHHAQDQAETLLLNLLRGAGIEGLSAIPHTIPLGRATLYRPLLELAKMDLDAYRNTHKLPFVEDESNADVNFNRNYIRHELMPIIEKRWPSYEKAIARTVSHCQQAKKNLTALAKIDAVFDENKSKALSLEPIKTLSFERQINSLRQWFSFHETQCPSQVIIHRIVTELMFAKDDASPCIYWGNNEVRRYQSHLYLLNKTSLQPIDAQIWKDFPKEHPIKALGQYIGVKHPTQLDLKEPPFIRFREGGESMFVRGHHHSLKKLMQEWGVPPWERTRVPLIYAKDQLIAVVGYATADTVPRCCSFYAEPL